MVDPRWIDSQSPGPFLLEVEDVPETHLHNAIISLLEAILEQWVLATGREARIARNFACRWDPNDARVGMDPDLALLEPPPSDDLTLPSLRVWEPGHVPPRVVFEVVSPSTGKKDYEDAAARCALLGAEELWVFDPLMVGPKRPEAAIPLQIWQRQGGRMVRVHAGPPPAKSPELDAWLVLDAGGLLRLADDPWGSAMWPTATEAERALVAEERALVAEERARAEEAERRAREETARADEEAERRRAAEAELERLRALLKE